MIDDSKVVVLFRSLLTQDATSPYDYFLDLDFGLKTEVELNKYHELEDDRELLQRNVFLIHQPMLYIFLL